MKKLLLSIPIVLAAALLGWPAPQAGLKRYTFSEPHMGTLFRIVLYAADEQAARAAAKAAFARAAELDGIMSDYRDTSELMQLCKKAGGPPVKVSADLFAVLARAKEIAKLSGGAFDVSAAPAVRLWREARRTRKLPTKEELGRALKLVGYERIRLDARGRTVELLLMGMLLDLGGIAKGYAAEMMLAVLRRHGITRALVAAGGDIVVGDPPPEARGWKVGVAPPEKADVKPTQYLLLKNAAVSTSGDTEQYVEIGGKRYSHIVDPKTGLGLTRRGSVTVVAADGTTADALATALSVMGPERGLPLVEAMRGTAALFVVVEEMGQKSYASKRFAAYGWKD
jgi:thiamine biosynthesis lipoprotein